MMRIWYRIQYRSHDIAACMFNYHSNVIPYLERFLHKHWHLSYHFYVVLKNI